MMVVIGASNPYHVPFIPCPMYHVPCTMYHSYHVPFTAFLHHGTLGSVYCDHCVTLTKTRGSYNSATHFYQAKGRVAVI